MCELPLNVHSPEEGPPQPPLQLPADDQGPLPSSSTTEETTQPPAQDNSGTSAGAEGEPVMEPEEPESEQGGGQGGVAASVEPQRQRVTWQSLESQRRRFNYDVIPKACSNVVSCDSHVISCASHVISCDLM